MKIRKATKKDILQIGKLMKIEFNKPPYEDGWTDSSVRRTLNNYFKIGYGFVVYENKEIIGVIIVRDEPYAKRGYIVIEELVVKSELQNKGIGKLLMKRVEREAQKKKACAINLYSSKKSKAFGFYKKLRYKEDKNFAFMEKKLKN